MQECAITKEVLFLRSESFHFPFVRKFFFYFTSNPWSKAGQLNLLQKVFLIFVFFVRLLAQTYSLVRTVM